MGTVALTEAAEALAPVSRPTRQPDGSLKFYSRILKADGWGSTAYYPAEPMRRDGPSVFGAGLKMYVDHPTRTESWDRQERSIRDIGGKLAEAATYREAFVDEDGKAQPAGLYAPVVVNPHSADLIEAMWEEIGLSIRADAEADTGTVDGRTGHVVTKFVEAKSVDFVTKAGAGGALISLLESHRAAEAVEPVQLAEALPGGLTFDDLRQALRELVRAITANVDAYSELEDFTDTYAVFRVVDYSTTGSSARSTWRQDYTAADSGGLALTGDPVQVRQVTSYVEVPAGDPAAATLPTSPRTTTVVGSEAAAVAEAHHPTATPGGDPVTKVQVEESEYTALQASAGRISAVEAERDEARREVARRDARDSARPIVTQLLSESASLPAAWQPGLVEEALRSVPLTSDLRLDEGPLRSLTESIRTREETKLAQLREAAGEGTPSGLGPQTTSVQSAGGGGGADGTQSQQQSGGEHIVTQESYVDDVRSALGTARKR